MYEILFNNTLIRLTICSVFTMEKRKNIKYIDYKHIAHFLVKYLAQNMSKHLKK